MFAFMVRMHDFIYTKNIFVSLEHILLQFLLGGFFTYFVSLVKCQSKRGKTPVERFRFKKRSGPKWWNQAILCQWNTYFSQSECKNFLQRNHEGISVLITLIYLPFGHLSHSIQRKYQIRLPFDGTNTCPGASFELYRSKINSKIRFNPETLLLLRVYWFLPFLCNVT